MDRLVHADEWHLPRDVVSDGTRQPDSTIAFAGCIAGGAGWVGRVHLPSMSYESAVAGLLQSLDVMAGLGVGSIAVSDCQSALYTVHRTLRCRPTASRSCLMTAAPLFCFASEHLDGRDDWDGTKWTWTQAHTDASEVVLGTLTTLQDWCDRTALMGAEIPSQASEFYEYDVCFLIFCERAGSIPGLQTRSHNYQKKCKKTGNRRGW